MEGCHEPRSARSKVHYPYQEPSTATNLLCWGPGPTEILVGRKSLAQQNLPPTPPPTIGEDHWLANFAPSPFRTTLLSRPDRRAWANLLQNKRRQSQQ